MIVGRIPCYNGWHPDRPDAADHPLGTVWECDDCGQRFVCHRDPNYFTMSPRPKRGRRRQAAWDAAWDAHVSRGMEHRWQLHDSARRIVPL